MLVNNRWSLVPTVRVHRPNSISRALAIGAHPDDVELGCGGLIALLARAGVHIEILVVTDGAANGRSSAVRYEEARVAARVLGVSGIRFGAVPDGRAARSPELTGVVEQHVFSVCPDVVLSHSINVEEHDDHAAIAKAVNAVCLKRDVPILGFEGPTYVPTTTFSPTLFIDIQDVWDVKQHSILSHGSELNRGSISLALAHRRAQYRALECCPELKLAEAFDGIKSIGSDRKTKSLMIDRAFCWHDAARNRGP